MAQATKYISFLQPIDEAWVTRAIYSLVFYLLVPLVVGRVFWRSIREPRYSENLPQRLGVFSAPAIGQTQPVWVHAVSAGETIAAKELVERLLDDGHSVILSNMTPTGRDRAEQLFGNRITNVYAPYDLPHAVSWFLSSIKPVALVIIDTELWPNMVAQSRKAGIPVCLVNGRLSEKSARGYKKADWLTRSMFAGLSQVFAQTDSQAQRFRSLGAPQVLTTGSIKFDAKLPADFTERTSALQALLQTQTVKEPLNDNLNEMLNQPLKQPIEKSGSRSVILGASTHEGEEAALLAAYQKLDREDVLLVLAPRHTHRVAAVVEFLEKANLSFQKHSNGEEVQDSTRVYLLDTMGELIYFYGICQIAFVGGSLVDVGGHNPMEPGGLGKPMLMGPHRRNISDIADQFAEAGALITVSDAGEIYAALSMLLNQANEGARMSEAALLVMSQNRGAVDRVCEVLLPLLRENKS